MFCQFKFVLIKIGEEIVYWEGLDIGNERSIGDREGRNNLRWERKNVSELVKVGL